MSTLPQALSKASSIELNGDEFIRHIDYNKRNNTLSFFSDACDEDFVFNSSSINNAVYDQKNNEWALVNEYGAEHTIQLFIVKAMKEEDQLPTNR